MEELIEQQVLHEKPVPLDASYPQKKNTIKVYKRRWGIIILYMLVCFSNTTQWSQYTIITNIISRFYNVSNLSVALTAIFFNICSVIFCLPICYIERKLGLRKSVIISVLGSTIGLWIKWGAVYPNMILVAYLGQGVTAMCHSFVVTLPPQIAATWFSSKEVAFATSLAYFGSTMGVAITCWLIPVVVKNHEKIVDIQHNLSVLLFTHAVFCTLVSFAILVFFQEEPPQPPSQARAVQKILINKSSVLFKSWKNVMSNKYFLMLLFSYATYPGIMDVMVHLINLLFLSHYENGEEDAGNIALLMIMIGSFSSLIFCTILDRLKAYKKMMMTMEFFALTGFVTFVFTLSFEVKWGAYVGAIVMGSFIVVCLPMGLELATEIVYPDIDVSANMMNMVTHIYTIVSLPISINLFETYGEIWTFVYLVSSLVLGFLTLCMIKEKRRRQKCINANMDITGTNNINM